MRISDWSSDVCSSDLPTVTPTSLLAGGRNEEREDREDQPSKNQSPSKNFVASANPLVSDGAWHSQPYRNARASYRLIIIRPRQGQQRYRPMTDNLVLELNRKSAVLGTSVSVRVHLGGSRLFKKKIIQHTCT